MDLFDLLNLIGGLSLFLFGMNLMGQALERRAGSRLRLLLGKMTGSRAAGFLTGLGITAVIQSSSATTVMVVGFVNSGLMTLHQAINVIMGANVGTTVTAWILSLGGIDGSGLFITLLKPTSFTPLLALIGIIFYMFCKSEKKKDTGTILLGFATLMFGMETMSSAVSGLSEVEGFRNLLLLFTNPLFGVAAGALLTAVIQSSSASVGILQSLSDTGQVSFGIAVPIIMGQNIGTCITAILSSVGTNKNAKRAALVHLLFNVLGTVVWLSVFAVIKYAVSPAILDESATRAGIATVHSLFNILCTILMLPLSGVLERLVTHLVPDAPAPEAVTELDERLFAAPPLALERCNAVALEMADCAVESLREAVQALHNYTPDLADSVRRHEERTDHLEDALGTYLVELSAHSLSADSSAEAAKLLKVIGDFERISDHSVNIIESAEELHGKGIVFTGPARTELDVLTVAVQEVAALAVDAFAKNDVKTAIRVEPLEQVVDDLREKVRPNHMSRLRPGLCSIDAGFVWSDLLTDFERISDHCSNIAVSVIDAANKDMNAHAALLQAGRSDGGEYARIYKEYTEKYSV